MRNLSHNDRIFDTCIDTEKFYVPMKHKIVLRKDHIDSKGKSALYLNVTQHGQRERIPIDLRINPGLWNEKKERITGKDSLSQDINLILDNIDRQVTEIKTTFRLNEIPLTLKIFKEEFTNASSRTDFIVYMWATLQENSLLMNKNTYKAEVSIWRKLKKWRPFIKFSEINISLITAYKNHCAAAKNRETTINKNLAIIKKYLNLAQGAGIKMPFDTKQIVVGQTDGDRTHLDGEEVDNLAEYFTSKFIQRRHKVTLAMFLLGCFNGLRISDAQQLTPNNIDKGKIYFTSIKTKKRQIIQINLTTQSILDYCPEVLTEKFTDQHHNRILKEVCEVVGINKHVTFHVARHTFATNYLRLGGKVEILQQILGHSKITETMIYVHIVQEEMDRGMAILDGLIAGSHFSQLQHNIAS